VRKSYAFPASSIKTLRLRRRSQEGGGARVYFSRVGKAELFRTPSGIAEEGLDETLRFSTHLAAQPREIRLKSFRLFPPFRRNAYLHGSTTKIAI